ncbi:C-type lectin domain family 2 member D11-like [Microtus ochrogaster]|uniref:C-type lectin domain family 2 member D11-like n=1 Tax=Microtus ochrogaster TaxID=79684 RepID=A0ABM0LSK8_MICOH|nr:C-type lectin domain family 2 member D11-like [Microtus ochrogaster]
MSEDSGGLSNSDEDEPPDEIGDNRPAYINGDDEELQEVIGENLPEAINRNNEEQHLVGGKKLQEKCLRIVSPISPARLHCCYAVIIVLTGAVIALSVALSLSGKTEQVSSTNTYAVCPRNWIGFGNKCFYFSEDTNNQTASDNYCMARGAQLAKFDSQEELNFLNRYKGDSDHWIGLHRESSEHPWIWTDNTEYNNWFPIRGEENYAYMSDNKISSARNYTHKKCICSKPYSYIWPCPVVSQLV